MTPSDPARITPDEQLDGAQAVVAPLASLRARLSFLILLALIPAALFLIYDALAIRQQVHSDAQAELLRLTEVVADSYGQQVEEAERLLAAIALFPEVRTGNAAECSARLAQMVALYQPRYFGFAAADLDGEMFCSSTPVTPTVQVADRLWFRESVRTGEFAIGEYTTSRPSGEPLLGLGYPVLDENGKVTRVLAYGLRLNVLQAEASELPLPADAVLTITDRNGVILVRVPGGEQWIGQRQPATALQQLALAGENVVTAAGADGVERLYAFAPLLGPSGAQVWLSIGRTPEILYATEGRAIQRDLIGVGGILLVTLAALWWGSNQLLLGRIDQLVGASTRLAAGDWEARAPVRAPIRAAGVQGDELDKLALTFNQMADTLLQRQTELATRERHLHLAMQAARMVAWTWDPVYDHIITTDNFAEVYGLSPIQYIAQGFGLLHPDDKERHSGIVTRAAAEHIPYHSEFRIIRPDNGQTIWLDERAVPILDAAGNLQKFAGVVVDITERKQANEALRQASTQLEARVRERTAELERSNRELNQFAYVASHDLKAPLRAIDNLANWITEDAASVLPPHSAEHLTKLRGRVRRMEKLLDDLLTYSRAGRVRPPVETVDLNLLVQDIVAVLAPPPGFTITVEQPAPALRTPRVWLELVLRNLVGNAIKHHDQPGGQICVCAVAQGDLVEFTVSDDGPGIEPQYHQRIFEMYQTLSPRDQTEGSGMGLALVKKLVESYGGAITVESTAGQGATFRFTWPRWLDGTDEPG